MIEQLMRILSGLLSLLPDDPLLEGLQNRLDTIADYMGYINFFIPFNGISHLVSLWVLLITTYFTYVHTKKFVVKYSDKLSQAVGGIKNILGNLGGND